MNHLLLDLLVTVVELVKLACSIIKRSRTKKRSTVWEMKETDLESRSPDGRVIRLSERFERWEREE